MTDLELEQIAAGEHVERVTQPRLLLRVDWMAGEILRLRALLAATVPYLDETGLSLRNYLTDNPPIEVASPL